MMPGQVVIVFHGSKTPRLLLGREAMLYHGFPISRLDLDADLDGFSDSLLTQIAGDMISCPVLLSLALASFASVSWRSAAHASVTELPPTSGLQCRDALAAFSLLAQDNNDVGEDGDCSGAAQPRLKAFKVGD